MPKPFGCPDPTKQMTRLTNALGAACPIAMVIREGCWNGFDAALRYKEKNPESEIEQCVYIHRDHEYPNKLCITNTGGDYMSRSVVENHFGTIANSGHESEHNNGFDATKGQGAKISYLPHAPEGILYRSKPVDGDGIKFHCKMFPNEGYYGFEDFYCDVEEITTIFPVCESFSSQVKNSFGTEMVLMGGSKEQDTWLFMNEQCGSGTPKSGWSLVRYISNRLLYSPPIPIKVAIYDKEGKFKAWHQCQPLSDQMKHREVQGTVELPESDGVVKGTKVHYALLSAEDRGVYFTTLSGFVGFSYKQEIYIKHKVADATRRAELNRCGIYTKANRWMLVIEIPSSYDVRPSEDRTHLRKLDKQAYYSSFHRNMPEEIKDWLAAQNHGNISEKDLAKWLKEKFSDFSFNYKCNQANPSDKSLNLPTVLNKSKGKGTGANGNRRPNSRREGVSCLKSFVIPKIQFIKDEQDSPLARFDLQNYTLYINVDNKTMKSRMEPHIRNYNSLSVSEIENEVSRYVVSNVIYRIFEVQKLSEKDESIENKKCRWEAKILEACWSDETSSMLSTVLKKKHNRRSITAAK